MSDNKNSKKPKNAKAHSKKAPATEESNYECKTCLVTDNIGKVSCDECHLWYHFECVNTSMEAVTAMDRWTCVTCEGKNQMQSDANQQRVSNSTTDSTSNQEEQPFASNDQQNAGQTVNDPTVVAHSTPRNVNTPISVTRGVSNKSQKSLSVASSKSRRATLALQRLEEEKELQEKREREDRERRDKRDQEYLDKKYSLLDLDSDDEISLADSELERVKRDRMHQWSEDNQEIVVVELSTTSEFDSIPAITRNKQNIESNQPKNGHQPNNKSKNPIVKTGRIAKTRRIITELPSWLTSPIPSNPTPWKVPSTTTSSIANSLALSTNSPTIITNAVANTTNPSTLTTTSSVVATNSSTSIPVVNQPRSSAMSSMALTTQQQWSMAQSSSNYSAAPIINQSSENQMFYFGKRPTTSNDPVSNTGNTASAVNTKPRWDFPMQNPSIGVRTVNMTSNIVKDTSTPLMSTSVYSSIPATINQIPTSENRLPPWASYPPPRWADIHPNYLNQQSTAFNVQHPNVQQSNARQPNVQIVQYPNSQQLKVQQPYMQQSHAVYNGISSSPIVTIPNVSSVTRSWSNASPIYSSASEPYSSSFAHTSYMHRPTFGPNQSIANGNAMSSAPTISNTNTNAFGQSNYGYQSNIPVNDSNQFPAMNLSTSSTHRARLTAEQIAARHVIPKLPHFNGDPRYWLVFISAYENSTSECGFTNVENLGRLRESIKGDAYDAVASRLYHPDSVPAVIDTLRLLFGRPELIIESMVDQIKKESSPKDDDLGALIKFAIAVQNLSGSIQETGAVEHLRNPTLMNAITDKLPTQVQLNWACHRHSIGVVDLSHLGNWLYGLAGVASQVVRKTYVKPTKNNNNNNNNNNSNSNAKQTNFLNTQVENPGKKGSSEQSTQKPTKNCPACNTQSCSKISSCKKFKSLTRSDKWAIVKEHKLCTRCLGGHSFYRCSSVQSCRAEGCTKKHHTLLHDNKKSPESSKNERQSTVPESKPANAEVKTPTSVCNSQRSKNNRTDIFRIVPIVLYNKKKVIRDFAYLDDGSNLTLMEDELANELDIVGTPESVCIDWAFGQSHESEESRIVSAKIAGFYHQAQRYKLDNIRTVKNLHLPTQALTSDWIKRFSHLRNIPIATYEAAKPRMLIGLQYSKLTIPLETVEGEWEEPIACRTRLGWVLQGPSYDDGSQIQTNVSMNLCQCQSTDNQLHQLVKEYFSIENFGVNLNDKPLESRAIQRARQILESTTMKKNGRYQSGLLWKYDEINLPNSYNMALKRLQCLESKMTKNPQLAENLCIQMRQFVEKGYIRKLSPIELETKNDRVWYLPIFPVFNPKKPEKVRIVWDAAAKVKNVSLNSLLLTGPDLLVPLVDILRRFREKRIAILGDIKEMYHQIAICERDQNVQRFLWRDGDSSKNPDVYVMLVATFGATCSPCTAQFVKNKNADEYKEKHPEATNAIINSTYVDDLLDCVHNVEDAVKLVNDIKYVNQQGGFETRNFLSNSKELLERIGEHNTQQNKNLNISTNLTLGTERALGMFWNAETDNFTYSLKYTRVNEKILNGDHCPTKREVLRILMSIFDPLGLIANFLVYAKIILQEIWRSETGWDEQITASLQKKWIKWITALKDVENVQIPRIYSPKLSSGSPNSIQLHMFCDASVEAFSAVGFLRIKDEHGIDCSLVGAKTKVAPNKPMSVGRLELQAAVLGTRLAGSIKTSLRLEVEKTVYWSDSKNVMGWINSEARRYHQFVAFRITEILESTNPTDWKWVPTEHNVADEATKSKIQKLDSSSRWFKGPEFLCDEEDWFTEETENNYSTVEEIRPSFVMACRQVQSPIVDVKRFSQWNRLVRTMAYVFRFIHNLKVGTKRRGPLLQEEIIRGENQLYRFAQQDHYMDEIILVERNAKLPDKEQIYLDKSSELYRFSPYLDEHGVLRVKGRTDAAECLNFDAKRPIIMPRRHYITKLIVDHYHRRYLHLNHQTAINEIRQKFDIPALRVVMKEIRNSCQKCKNDSAVPQIPEMAELPLARLAAYARPYTYVGVDYFGPFKVRVNRSTAKRWGVLYTCLTTRAIHLEVAHSLSTSSCIMAFDRFGTACGYPRYIHSDNGSNFHGMDNELKEEFKKLDQDEIQRTFTNAEMEWSFNPPASPHMGGAWERLIRTVKSCFKKIVTTRNPTDETLPTLFAQIENIVNSRPLTYVSLESEDDEALTPNHFLFGSSNGRKSFCNTSPKDLNRNDWKNIEEQTNQFWRRFVLEYMPTLTKRTKWFQQSKPVEVGDVVIIVDEKNPRNTWPKGIVEQTFIGKGGKRRQAIVRAVLETKNGPVHKEYKRSVHKLAVLDVKVAANEEVNQQPVESINGGETVGQH